jgi:hypothetical protein
MPNKAGLDDTLVLPKPALHSALKAPHAVVNVSLYRHFVMFSRSLAPYLSSTWRPGWKEPRSHGGLRYSISDFGLSKGRAAAAGATQLFDGETLCLCVFLRESEKGG